MADLSPARASDNNWAKSGDGADTKGSLLHGGRRKLVDRIP